MIRQSNIYKHDITVTYYEAKLIHITVNKYVNTVEPRYKKVRYDTYLLQDNPTDPSSLHFFIFLLQHNEKLETTRRSSWSQKLCYIEARSTALKCKSPLFEVYWEFVPFLRNNIFCVLYHFQASFKL